MLQVNQLIGFGAGGGGGGLVCPTTAYTNTGGQGDRTSGGDTVTVTTDLVLGGGTIDNSVDGATGNTNDDGWFDSAQAVSGLFIKFDFSGIGTVLIDECKWFQALASSLATWKWQGSNNDSDWTDIGSSFVLGNSTEQTQTELSGNTTGYQYYRLLGVSGTSAAAQRTTEVEFKISTCV